MPGRYVPRTDQRKTKDDVLYLNHADTTGRPRLSPSHPFWLEAIKLRQEYASYAYIAEQARIAGYPEFTITTIMKDLKLAPAVLQLPSHAASSLKAKYKEATSNFSAYDTIKDLINDVLAEMNLVEEELQQEDLTYDDRRELKQRYDDLRLQAYNWSRDAADLQLKIEDIRTDRQLVANTQPLDVTQYLDALALDFQTKIPLPSPAQLIEQYGPENVRFPTLEAELVPSLPEEETSPSTPSLPVDDDDLPFA